MELENIRRKKLVYFHKNSLSFVNLHKADTPALCNPCKQISLSDLLSGQTKNTYLSLSHFRPGMSEQKPIFPPEFRHFFLKESVLVWNPPDFPSVFSICPEHFSMEKHFLFFYNSSIPQKEVSVCFPRPNTNSPFGFFPISARTEGSPSPSCKLAAP